MVLDANGNGRRPVTWNVKSDILDAFSEYCKSKGMLPSRRVEILILQELKQSEKYNSEVNLPES